LYTAVGFVEESEFNNDKTSVKYRVVTLLSAVRMLLRSMWCHHANSNSNNTTCQLHSIAAAAAAAAIIGDVSLTTTLLGL
jgi:CRISPR/Cas system Type II protein with McrA/HNH and RuvC-like nuclease domain